MKLVTKFSNSTTDVIELKDTKEYKLREKINNGEKLNREEKDYITNKVIYNSWYNDSIALRGFRFNFEDILKVYVVKRYEGWQEYRAIDKTSLRNVIGKGITKIVEVK